MLPLLLPLPLSHANTITRPTTSASTFGIRRLSFALFTSIACRCSWLGRRRATTARPQTDENGIPRDIATAPAWATLGADTAPEAQPDPDLAIMKPADEEPDRTEIRTEIQRGAPPTALQMSYMRLFGKRNAYADVKADSGDTFSDLFSKTSSQAGRTPSGRRTGFSDYSDAVDTVETENRRTPGSMLSSAASGRRVNILTMGGDKTRGRRGRGDRRRADGDDDDDEEEGDWMKTLLTDKSRKRQRQRRRRHIPLPDRINDFYKKLDKLKEDEKAPPTKEFQRRWIMLTRGVKAALAESSDEEEQVLHTI